MAVVLRGANGIFESRRICSHPKSGHPANAGSKESWYEAVFRLVRPHERCPCHE
jgi:hypothetical protein